VTGHVRLLSDVRTVCCGMPVNPQHPLREVILHPGGRWSHLTAADCLTRRPSPLDSAGLLAACRTCGDEGAVTRRDGRTDLCPEFCAASLARPDEGGPA
jgi:hypothetical protein